MLEMGFIKLYRSMTKWEWYTDNNTKAVFLHLLLTVNYEDSRWRGIAVRRGQRIVSYETLVTELGLSVRNVRTALEHLTSTGELTIEKSSVCNIITVVSYDKYQDTATQLATPRQDADKVLTDDRQAADKALTDNRQQCNKDNKAKKDKNCYGEFENVLLSLDELEKLQTQFPDYQERIERLSQYLASSGKTYKNHYATILKWTANDNNTSQSKSRMKKTLSLLYITMKTMILKKSKRRLTEEQKLTEMGKSLYKKSCFAQSFKILWLRPKILEKSAMRLFRQIEVLRNLLLGKKKAREQVVCFYGQHRKPAPCLIKTFSF